MNRQIWLQLSTLFTNYVGLPGARLNLDLTSMIQIKNKTVLRDLRFQVKNIIVKGDSDQIGRL